MNPIYYMKLLELYQNPNNISIILTNCEEIEEATLIYNRATYNSRETTILLMMLELLLLPTLYQESQTQRQHFHL